MASHDHSIWEDAKKTSPLALKRLINGELENSTVTAVLIGTQHCGLDAEGGTKSC